MYKYLKNLWEFETKITKSWRKLKYEKMQCICWKISYKRLDLIKYDSNCWCIQIEKSKKEIIIWKLYNNIIPIKEIEQYISTSWKTKKRMYEYKCNLCWDIWAILVDRIWKNNNCWCNKSKKHWRAYTSEYNIFYWIKWRCNNPNDKAYENYWWRWIKCEWESFEEFYKDMWESYVKWLSIERIDNDWNYSKENCTWATRKDQTRNRRNTLKFNWISLAEICENRWIDYNITYKRIHELWWSFEKAIW